jgi:hypothetical protein
MRVHRDRRIGRAIAGLVAVASLVLAGCGEGSASGNAGGGGLFFPTRADREGGDSMAALHQGPLVVRHGCVLIGQPGNYSLPVWWNGFTAKPDPSGRVVVRDSGGTVVAIEGETFKMGGGYTAEFRPQGKVRPRQAQIASVEKWLGFQIPERCLTPDVYGVWVVGDTDPLPTSASPSAAASASRADISYRVAFPNALTQTDTGLQIVAKTNLPEGTLYLVNTPNG